MKYTIVITVVLYDNNDIKIDISSGIIYLLNFGLKDFM